MQIDLCFVKIYIFLQSIKHESHRLNLRNDICHSAVIVHNCSAWAFES